MVRKPHDIYEPQDYAIRRRRRIPKTIVHFSAGVAFFGFTGLVIAQMLDGPAQMAVNVERVAPTIVPLRAAQLEAPARSAPVIMPLRRAAMFDPDYLQNAAPVSFGQQIGLRTAFVARPVAVATTEEEAEDQEIANVEAPLPAPRPPDLVATAEPAPEFPLPPPRPDGLVIARRIEAPAPTAPAAPVAVPPTAAPAAAAPQPTRTARAPAAKTAAAPAAKTAAVDGGSFLQKLFGGAGGGRDPSGPQLAYAAPQDGAVRDYSFGAPANRSGFDRYTAIYDISAKTVYLPNGGRLEAHSGLGAMMDDPRSETVRMRGVTPPALYDLREREALFHGVRALRLTPLNSSVHGRSGLLAHTFMLGPSGQSNGCVSFRNYDAFLQAYLRGDVKRLAVVAKL